MASQVVTGEVRFSFLHVFQPWSGNGAQSDDEGKYSVTALIPKQDISTKARLDAAIQTAYQKGVSDKWNGKQPPLNAALYDGDGVRRDGSSWGPEAKGCWVLKASSRNKPDLVDESCQHIMEQRQLYSGCYGRIGVDFGPYSNNGNNGISCYLNTLQKLRDGEPLGAGMVSAEDDFGAPAPTPAYPAQAAPAYAPTPAYPAQAAPAYAPTPAYPAQAAPGYAPPQTYAAPQPTPAGYPAINPLTGRPYGM